MITTDIIESLGASVAVPAVRLRTALHGALCGERSALRRRMELLLSASEGSQSTALPGGATGDSKLASVQHARAHMIIPLVCAARGCRNPVCMEEIFGGTEHLDKETRGAYSALYRRSSLLRNTRRKVWV